MSRHWIFGPFELIPDQGWLSRNGEAVEIRAKPLALLVALIERSARTVAKDELLEIVWEGRVVSDAAFSSAVRDLRRALGEDASRPRYVETVRGEGLRFAGPAHELPPAGQNASSATPRNVWQAAALNLERALDAVERVEQRATSSSDGRSRIDIQITLARAQWAAGDTERARATFLEAAEGARAEQRWEDLARCALGYAGRTDATLGVNVAAVRLLEEALAALPPAPTSLRSECLARLGTEVHYEGDGSRSLAFTKDAVECAERVGEPAALAYALTARHFARTRPDGEPAERLALAERAIALLEGEPHSDTLAIALQEAAVDRLELGDGPGFRASVERLGRTAATIDQPFFAWMASSFAAHRAILDGDLEHAEPHAQAAFDLGRELGTPNALPVFIGQMILLRRLQGRSTELLGLMGAESERFAELPVFRSAAVAVFSDSGEHARAAEWLEAAVAYELSDLPQDLNWLSAVAFLSVGAARVGDPQTVALLERTLAPFGDRVVPVAYGASSLGAVAHHLGELALRRGATDQAASRFASALEIHERLAAPLWVRETERAIRRLERGA